MMGSGKSTIAKLLADRLNIQMFDLDEEIIHKENRTIANIFEQDGEEYFRDIEQRTLADIYATNIQHVLALGGGALNRPESLNCVRLTARLIYLVVDIQTLTERLSKSTHRPLLTGVDSLQKRLTTLFREREAIYKQAEIHVDATKAPNDIVQDIIEKLE